MKILIYEDENGYLRRSLVKDNDTTPEYGIPQNIPNLDNLDWNEIKKELHNELTRIGLITWADVQRGNLIPIVNKIFKRRLINLYKLEE